MASSNSHSVPVGVRPSSRPQARSPLTEACRAATRGRTGRFLLYPNDGDLLADGHLSLLWVLAQSYAATAKSRALVTPNISPASAASSVRSSFNSTIARDSIDPSKQVATQDPLGSPRPRGKR